MCWTSGCGKIIRLRVPACGELWTMLPIPGWKFRRISSRPFCAAWLNASAVPNGRMGGGRARTVPNCPRLRGRGGRRWRQVAKCGPSSRHQRRARLHNHPQNKTVKTFMNVVFVFYLIFWLGACARCAPGGHDQRLLGERWRGWRGPLTPWGLAGIEQFNSFSSKKNAVCTAQSAYI